jgi:RimJ/RimL family protein N-acetyltransferase
MLRRPAEPIRTPRLRLRPLRPDDVDALLAYRSREDVCRYVLFEPYTRERLLESMRRWADEEATGDGHLHFALERADDPAVLGDVEIWVSSAEHACAEVGYVLSPDAEGHGYATEACAALLRLAFDDAGLHRVIARIDARNDASAKLLRRVGMRQEAYLVGNEWLDGEWTDEIDFAMLAEEWPGSPGRALLVGNAAG